MNPLVKRLQEENAVGRFWQSSDTVLLAVSGGVDSMALLDAFHRLPEEEKPSLQVLHVHHHLREEAEQDCETVRDYCFLHRIPFQVRHWEPHLHPESNLEAAARAFRYHFFEKQMEEQKAAVLVTAHHADDQMETILMRLTRGSTLSGYAGIRKERPFGPGKLVRPFLRVEKPELYDYCQKYQVPYCEDRTNQTLAYTRNRYRHQVIPMLKKENEQAAAHFSDFSDDLQSLLDIALPVVEESFSVCFKKVATGWQLTIPNFTKMSTKMQQVLIGFFLQEFWSKEGVSFQRSHVQAILSLIAATQPQAELTLSGGKVRKRYERLYFDSRTNSQEEKTDLSAKTTYLAEMDLNEWLELPFNGKIGLFSYKEARTFCQLPTDTEWVYLEEGIKYPLYVRFWQSGDRIRLNKKAPFTKKISRIFIDKKIPREERTKAVIVADAEGTILWVPGHACSIWVAGEKETKLLKDKKNTKEKVICFTNNDEVK